MSKISTDSIKQPFWAMSSSEVFDALKTNPSGLAEVMAQSRLRMFGPNAIREQPRFTKTKIILNQVKSPLILVLIFAGAITIFLQEWINTGVIFAAVLINTILGFYQENKAETALELLKTYIIQRARVRRADKEREINVSELVPGDIIHISQGDRVPADARIIFANNLEIDEAVLTGESLPVEKDLATLPAATVLAERKCMVFGGTLIVQGFGDAIVTATGSDSEFGKIASLVAEKEREPTPLQRSILNFTIRAGLVLTILTLVLFGLGLYYGYGLSEIFLIAVAVAVSAVPEGLPIALTVILAIGVQRLALKKGVVRKLLAAETLGSTSLILTDKTGTLTQAKMELTSVLPYKKGEESKNLLLEAILNTDIVIENPDEPPENWRTFGRPLEVSLVKGAARRGSSLPQILKKTKILDRLPFSSVYKFSAAIAHFDSQARLILFGAPEIILRYTSLSEEERDEIKKEIDELAFSGERVLGVASKKLSSTKEKIPMDLKFDHLEFKGLITFRDPLRPRVAEAIRRIADSGVKTVIVTGDHRGTAEAVARELGMVNGRGAVLTGDDLNHLTREELKNRADQVSVYARVTPEQKVMLTQLYKERGEIVAVTGDGVNDAPALQTADIGVAVGSGTDVAKSAADLVILDDNFETIVAAIYEGRKILDNIRKVIVYLLSDSLDELFLIGGALLAGLALPLNALQILFVNFFSDSFPAMALAFEKGVEELNSGPWSLTRGIFDRQMRFLILVIGVLSSALLFVLYFFMLKFGLPDELVRTFIFSAFATYALLLAFSMRSLDKNIWSYNPFANHYLNAGVGIGLALTALVIYLPPFQNIFSTVALPLPWLAGVLGIGLLNILAVELGKWFLRK